MHLSSANSLVLNCLDSKTSWIHPRHALRRIRVLSPHEAANVPGHVLKFRERISERMDASKAESVFDFLASCLGLCLHATAEARVPTETVCHPKMSLIALGR